MAQLLEKRGAVVAPETIEYTGVKKQRQMPDVIVSFRGLRTAIEGEINASNARNKALESAKGRVETGLAHIGVGVVYPERLRHVSFSDLENELANAQLEIAVTTEADTTEFSTGDVDYLERLLRSTFDQLIAEDVVAESVELLDTAVDQFATAALAEEGNWGRIAIVLNGDMSDKELKKLDAKQRAANCRIGGLVLLNAMIFHDILARHQPRLSPLRNILSDKDYDKFISEWKYVLDNINYYAIFSLARSILSQISRATPNMLETLSQMVRTSAKISERRAALRHDLMGRVYHRLLAEAKYLGTYYTSIPAATMLLKLCLRRDAWELDWSNPDEIKKLNIADLACGTGTLLMATADAIVDNHVSMAAIEGKSVQLEKTHHAIAENVLHGYDVLPSAIHLTASTLAMRTPDIPLKKMNLFSLPLGGKDNMLGSIEFLRGNLLQMPLDLFGSVEDTPQKSMQISGKSMETSNHVSVPELDLCVMNPPFVRSVGGNLLFGSVPDKRRKQMQNKLKNIVKRSEIMANVNAGLGSVFIAIGHRNIKANGQLALVLPKALLSGVSWEISRQLINHEYRVDYIIVSHDAERWNFSDSTDLSEVLVIATKNENTLKSPPNHQTKIVNLWRNPTTALEGLYVATQIRDIEPVSFLSDSSTYLELDGKVAGQISLFPWDELRKDWFLPCSFAQKDLAKISYLLLNEGMVTKSKTSTAMPMCTLGDLGTLGYDARDIHDGFDKVDAPTNYKAFWGHDSKEILTMKQQPNQYLSPLDKPKPSRPLKDHKALWQSASQILIAERMRLNSQKLFAVYVSEKVLAASWWTFTPIEEVAKDKYMKVLVLWLNSTLAYLLILARRNETEGSWVKFKKPLLRNMPIIDVRKLSEDVVDRLAEEFDKICEQDLKVLPEMTSDETRHAIDLDSIILPVLESN